MLFAALHNSLLAQSGHRSLHRTCPLSAVKRTSGFTDAHWNLFQEKPRRSGARVDGIYLRTRKLPARLSAPIGNNLIVDRRAFIEGAQARALKRRDMHEHVLAAALRLNEAVSFCWIEPFNSTSSHSTLHRMLPPVRSPGLAI